MTFKSFGFGMLHALVFLTTVWLRGCDMPTEIVETIPVGALPTAIAITPNGQFAYVINKEAGTSSVIVRFINTATNAVGTITVPLIGSIPQPALSALAITPDGQSVYVTIASNSGTPASDQVSIINTATNTVSASFSSTGTVIFEGVAINPSDLFAWITDNETNVVDVYDTTNTLVATIPVGIGPVGIAITPVTGQFAYVANSGSSNVSVINTTTEAVTTIPVGSEPMAVAITPDGLFVYVTNFGGNSVSVIDAATNTVVATIPVGVNPIGVTVTPDGQFAYVTNFGDNTVSIINTTTNAVVATVTGIPTPRGVAITPNGQFAYVASQSSSTVYVLGCPATPVNGPTNVQGCRFANIFLTQTDFINKITWSSPATNIPVSYIIFRDAALTQVAATIPATEPLQFFDHNRHPFVIDTYYIVGVGASGSQSAAQAVTVNSFC